MARIPLLGRFRRHRESDPGAPVPDDVPRRPISGRRVVPTPGALRRERRVLLKARDDRIRDLGGLMLEMYRRDHYREELVFEQCAELVDLEERILELDALVSSTGRWPLASGHCVCGTPLVTGVHFCANCGRPAGEPVVGCPQCGRPLPGDANFCAVCGTAAFSSTDLGGDGVPPPPPPESSSFDLWEQ